MKSRPEMDMAVILPCYNEEAAIYKVVSEFRSVLPEANIYVFDNNSSDNTRAEALRAGAIVRDVKQEGKGNVVRRMFADVEADIYVMADGDGTYDAGAAASLVDALIDCNSDMVVGVRKEAGEGNIYRTGHRFGNKMLTSIVKVIFGRGFTDMLSGYRAFSRRFVKTFPAMSEGFEIETEITIHALQLDLPAEEIETEYYQRAGDSMSKLSTYKDGFRILKFIFYLFKNHKPILFFGLISMILIILSVSIFLPILMDYLDTGLVERVPTILLSTGLMLSALVLLVLALILDSSKQVRQENLKLHYLGYKAPKQAVKLRGK